MPEQWPATTRGQPGRSSRRSGRALAEPTNMTTLSPDAAERSSRLGPPCVLSEIVLSVGWFGSSATQWPCGPLRQPEDTVWRSRSRTPRVISMPTSGRYVRPAGVAGPRPPRPRIATAAGRVNVPVTPSSCGERQSTRMGGRRVFPPCCSVSRRSSHRSSWSQSTLFALRSGRAADRLGPSKRHSQRATVWSVVDVTEAPSRLRRFRRSPQADQHS